MATWVATYIDRLISYWCGQIVSRIYTYIYIYIIMIITDRFIERKKKYAYIILSFIAYDCWENGLWNITWIIITPDTNLSVLIPYMTAAYRNVPYHLDGPYGPAHVAGPFGPLSWECCPTRLSEWEWTREHSRRWISTCKLGSRHSRGISMGSLFWI